MVALNVCVIYKQNHVTNRKMTNDLKCYNYCNSQGQFRKLYKYSGGHKILVKNKAILELDVAHNSQ